MADIFTDDGGSATSPYDTWAKASTTFLVAVDLAAAGDRLIIGHDHAETPSVNTNYVFPGTTADPNIVISATSTAGGSVVTYNKADNVQIDITGANADWAITGGIVKLYGISIKCTDDIRLETDLTNSYWEDCRIELVANGRLTIGNREGRLKHVFKNVDLVFAGSADSSIRCLGGPFVWMGGSVAWSGVQPTALFDLVNRFVQVDISGVDLSAITSALVDVSDASSIMMSFHHCLLDSGVSLTTGTHNVPSTTILMSGCDDTTGNDLYRLEYVDFWGSTVHDDAIFRTTDGASDGTTPISWKMVSTANAAEFVEPTRSPPIYSWVDATGSTTFTVQCLWDSVTDIQDDEIWLEIEFLEASADTDSAFADDRMTDISSTPGDQTTNATAWTETLTNDNEFALAVTVTVNRVGPVIGRVYLAKPSTTIYVDPLVVKS